VNRLFGSENRMRPGQPVLFRFAILIPVTIPFIFFACSQSLTRSETTVLPQSTGISGNPSILFTHIPVYESFEDLYGRVLNVDPAKNRIMVFIQVNSLWRVKPRMENQSITIGSDGRWTCDITTETDDHRASRISAFLLPDTCSLPPYAENDSLPPDIFSRSLASMEIVRGDSALYRVVTFSDYLWQIKACSTMCGPGPNYFSASVFNVWRDSQSYLHLKITKNDTIWNCAEVMLQPSLGYGTYEFHIGKVDRFDNSFELGLFTWDEAPAANHREIDIKLSRCDQADSNNIEYDIQPFDQNGNRYCFNLDFNRMTTHSFTWNEDEIDFESSDQDDIVRRTWSYQGLDLPQAGEEKTHMNLWLCNPDSAQTETEIVIRKFLFNPLDIK
jgi:hypothetical protein